MARTSEETLSTRSGRPLSLARDISPSNSSRTGQKSFSKASRLENISYSPCAEDAAQFSNERLTTRTSSVPGDLPVAAESERRVIRGSPAMAGRACVLGPCRPRLADGQGHAVSREARKPVRDNTG